MNFLNFLMVAYSGGPMRLAYFGRVVVDILGIKSKDILLALREHIRDRIAGRITKITKMPDSLIAEGVLTQNTPDGREIAALLTENYPLQASIGCEILELEEIKQGENVSVNGQDFTGPLVVIRSCLLREISFVSLGADPQTSAQRLAASAHQGGTVNLSGDELKICNLLSVAPDEFQRIQGQEMPPEQDEIEKICRLLSISLSDFQTSRRQLKAAGLA